MRAPYKNRNTSAFVCILESSRSALGQPAPPYCFDKEIGGTRSVAAAYN